MKNLVLAFLLCIPMTAQASISCTLKDVALSAIPAGLSTALECSNPAAIKESVGAALDYLGICKEEDQFVTYDPKSVWGELCKYVMPPLVEYMVDYAIPDAWECKATNLKNAINSVVEKQCSLL